VTLAHAIPESLAGPLATIERCPLGAIPAVDAARVVRRIVDAEALAPRLDVAAFNSAP
jgi:FXSXX-COOH protein